LALSCSGLQGKDNQLWDDFWLRRGGKGVRSQAKRRIIDIISSYIKPGDSVLDAGSGSGFFSSYFISRGCNVSVVDFSEEALSLTRKNTQDKAKQYIKGDMLEHAFLKDYEGKFDVIFTDGLLEHYSREDQDSIIRNLISLKKKNGCLINFAPNRFSLWSLVRPFCMKIQERPVVMRELFDIHARNGLSVVSHGGISVLPFRISPEKVLGRYLGMLLYCIAV